MLGAQGFEAVGFVSVVPALQRRDRVRAGAMRSGWAESLLARLGEGTAQITVLELAADERAHDLGAKQRDGLGVVFRSERNCRHRVAFPRPSRERPGTPPALRAARSGPTRWAGHAPRRSPR